MAGPLVAGRSVWIKTLHLPRLEVVGFAHDGHEYGNRILFIRLSLEDARLFVSFAVVDFTRSVVASWTESVASVARV